MSRSNHRASFFIDSQEIAEDAPAFVIAEVGINHNGCLDTAKRLVDASKAAGASAVKFQKRDLQSIYQLEVLQRLKNFEQGFQYLIPILKDFELTADQMWEIKRYCDQQEILFLCTPFDVTSAELLADFDVAAFKVSSADLTNLLLLEKLAEYRKPLILSTGMSVESEVDCSVAFLKKLQVQFALLHCVSSYPVDAGDAKLQRISKLQGRYHCPIGYSGHDLGISLAIAARTLGACIIEKHVTLDRSMRGPDHKLSLLPKELKALVSGIRDVESALADENEDLLPAESLNQLVFRKSLAAAVPIRKGDVIEREMLTVKSPGSGLSVQALNKLVGVRIDRDLAVDDLFLPSDIEPSNRVRSVASLPWGMSGFVVRYHDFEQALTYEPQVLEFHLTYHDTLLDLPRELLAKHAEQLKDITLRVHCCEYIDENLFDLCSLSDDIVSRSKKTLQRVIDVTAELSEFFAPETPMIVFNCGAMSLQEEGRSSPIDPSIFLQTIKELDLRNTHLLAQNMPPNPWYFGGQWKGHYFTKADELINFCEATGQSLCLDLSHAYMSCVDEGCSFGDYIESLKPYVKHIHVSDARSSDGEGIQIGQGEIDFAEFFEVYKDYRGSWIPEVWLGHVNGNKGALEAFERLSALYRRAIGGVAKSAAHEVPYRNGSYSRNGTHGENGVHGKNGSNGVKQTTAIPSLARESVKFPL